MRVSDVWIISDQQCRWDRRCLAIGDPAVLISCLRLHTQFCSLTPRPAKLSATSQVAGRGGRGRAYHTGVENGAVWAVLYIAAVIGPALMSGYRSIVAFGLLNLMGLIVVAVLYSRGFASLWCVYAAAASILVLLHMVRRRRLPTRIATAAQPRHGGSSMPASARPTRIASPRGRSARTTVMPPSSS